MFPPPQGRLNKFERPGLTNFGALALKVQFLRNRCKTVHHNPGSPPKQTRTKTMPVNEIFVSKIEEKKAFQHIWFLSALGSRAPLGYSPFSPLVKTALPAPPFTVNPEHKGRSKDMLVCSAMGRKWGTTVGHSGGKHLSRVSWFWHHWAQLGWRALVLDNGKVGQYQRRYSSCWRKCSRRMSKFITFNIAIVVANSIVIFFVSYLLLKWILLHCVYCNIFPNASLYNLC